MIAEADLDGDGLINFHEFARLMQAQQQMQAQQLQQQQTGCSEVNYPGSSSRSSSGSSGKQRGKK